MTHIYFESTLYDLTDNIDRYYLHNAVDELTSNLSSELFINDYEEEEAELMSNCDKAHKAISSQDAKALKTIDLEGVVDYHSFTVVEKSLEEILKEEGFKVEHSLASDSLYITVNSQQVRISDHKRPAVIDGFSAIEHEYEGGELISKTGTFTKNELASVGIELNSNETIYYL